MADYRTFFLLCHLLALACVVGQPAYAVRVDVPMDSAETVSPQSGSPQSGSPQSGSPQSGSPQSGSPQSDPESQAKPKEAQEGHRVVSVKSLSGQELTGSLEQLDNRQLVIRSNDELKSFELRNLITVSLGETIASSPNQDSAWIELTGGSQIVGTRFAVEKRTATIHVDGQAIEIPASSVRAIRFRPPSKPLDPQWTKAVQAESAGDLLVLRRDEATLDQLEGVIGDIDDTIVGFELEGEKIPVKRTKLEGIIFFQPRHQQIQDPICKVREVAGSIWKVRSLELQDDAVRLVTTAGLEQTVPLARIAQFDFSSGNVVFLSDLEPESAQWAPFVESQESNDLLAQLYLPRRDRSFAGDQLWLGGDRNVTKYSRGIAIHSRTRLVYRLEKDYRKFTAQAGIDSRLLGRGHVMLVILGDNRELFRQAVSGKDPPISLDLEIEGVDRLTILVDFGEKADIADHLNLCDARVIK